MTSKLTGGRVEIRPGSVGGGIIPVHVDELRAVMGVLETHGFAPWHADMASTRDGVNYSTFVGVSRKIDPSAVQTVLDAN